MKTTFHCINFTDLNIWIYVFIKKINLYGLKVDKVYDICWIEIFTPSEKLYA